MKSEPAGMFHFSPRENRAHEIAWLPWSEDAFAKARESDKPILLAISAVWCHWCHVMDETTYSEPDIIAAINERYVPVRVDNDRRPDVNARYNQGGWPTTAFLTPDGALLAGATYLPPEHMRQALAQIADFYTENKGKIAERAFELRARVASPQMPNELPLDDSAVRLALENLESAYDEEYGGFGSSQKFPMIDALEFLLQEYRATGLERAYEMVARSMLGMATGGTYDHVEGGFFRYSTTRDWSIPHFEKMTEDHAGLLRILATLARTTRNPQFRNTLVSAIGYIRSTLRDPHTGFFAGSQDADEEYYSAGLDERRAMQAPYVDRTVYANWNAAMAAAFVRAGDVLEDDRICAEGLAVLDALHDRMSDSEGLLLHFAEPNGEPQVRGLLTDQSAYLRALLDAHEFAGEPRFLERAHAVAQAIQTRFGAPDGGYYDHASLEDELGNLTLRDRPLAENASIAESLLRLSTLAEDPQYRESAVRALQVYAETYAQAGIFAAPYARAVRRLLSAQASVALVGSPEETSDLREGAHALPAALLTVRTIPPLDSAALNARGFSKDLHPAAYVCAGTVCGPPARTVAELRDSYETLVTK